MSVEGIDGAQLEGREFHAQVWTGEELIIWGGRTPEARTHHSDGAVFHPAESRWRSVADSVLSARSHHASVWTGEALFVWGGYAVGSGPPDERSNFSAEGALYRPDDDEWAALPDAPEGRAAAKAEYVDGHVVVAGNVPRTDDFLVLSLDDHSWEQVAFSGDHEDKHEGHAGPEGNGGFAVHDTTVDGDAVIALAESGGSLYQVSYRAGEATALTTEVRISDSSDGSAVSEEARRYGIAVAPDGTRYVAASGAAVSRIWDVDAWGNAEIVMEDESRSFEPPHLADTHPFNQGSLFHHPGTGLVATHPGRVDVWDGNGDVATLDTAEEGSFCGPLVQAEPDGLIGWEGDNGCGRPGALVEFTG
ncbi:hypothetical protein GCM10028793_01210 [Nocardiopsis oceani]